MNNQTKLEVACEILDNMIAFAARSNLSSSDFDVKQLVKEKQEVLHFNEETIDRVINEYGKVSSLVSGEAGGINE